MSEFQFVGNLADMVPGQDDGEGFQYQGVLVPPKLKGKTKEFSLDELDGFDPGKDHPWQFTFKTGEKVGELPTDEQNALDLEKRAAAGRAWATRKYEEYKHEAMSELERPGSGSQNFNRLLWANKNALPFGRAIAKFGEGVVSGDLRKQFEENPHMMDENSIAALADLDAREEYNRPKTIMQSIGQGVAALPAFATEIALGAGIGGRASTVAKAGLRGQVASPIAREAIGMAASAAANPATAVAGLSSAGDRAAAGERLDSALTKGFIDGYIEVLSEGVGGMKAVQHAQSLLASRFGKVLPAKVAENLAAWYDKSRLKDLAKATQQHGFVGELGEERAGELMRMATTAIPGAELGTLEETGGITYDVPTGAFNLATGNTAEARRHFGEAAKQAAIEAGVIGAPVALRLAAGIGQRPDAPNAPQSPQIAPPGQPGLTPVQPPPIAPAGQLEAQEPAPEPQAPGGQAFDAVRKIFAEAAAASGDKRTKVEDRGSQAERLKELAKTEGFPDGLKSLIEGLPRQPSRETMAGFLADAKPFFDDTAQPAPVFDTLKETALDPQAEPEVVRDVAAAAVNDAGTPDAVAEAIARDQQEGTPESLQGLRDAIAQAASPVPTAAVQEAPATSSQPIISGATRVAVGGQQAQPSAATAQPIATPVSEPAPEPTPMSDREMAKRKALQQQVHRLKKRRLESGEAEPGPEEQIAQTALESLNRRVGQHGFQADESLFDMSEEVDSRKVGDEDLSAMKARGLSPKKRITRLANDLRQKADAAAAAGKPVPQEISSAIDAAIADPSLENMARLRHAIANAVNPRTWNSPAQQPDPNVSEAGATVVEPTERKDQTSEKDQAEVGQGGLQGPLVRPTQESATTDQTPQPTAVAQPSPGEAMNRAAVPVVEQPQPQEKIPSEAPPSEPSQEVVSTPPPQAEPTPSVETQPKSPRQKAKEKATSDIRKQLPDMLRAANDEVGRKGGKKLTPDQMDVVLKTLYAWEEAYLVPQKKNLGHVIGEDFFKGQLDDNGEWLYQTDHTIRRAAVRLITGGRAIMAVGKDTNFSSYMHELAHVMSQWLTEGADREIANEYVGAKPGTNPRDWDSPQQEKWAKGFESAMTDNKPQPRKESMSNAEWKFRGLMRRIRDAMMEVYGKVFSGLSADDKPKGAVLELYRRLLGQEQAKVKDATKFRDQWVAKNQKIVGGQQAAEERKQAAETGQDSSGRKVMTRAEFDAALTTEFYNELNKLAAGLKKRVDAYRGMDTDEMVSNAVDKVLEENLFTEFDPAAGKTLAQWLMSKTYPDRMEKGQVSQDQARQEKSRKGRVSKKDLDDNPDEVLFARGDEYQPTTRNLGMAPTGITPVTAKDVRDFITKLFDGMPILIKRNLAYGAYGLYKARAQITKLTKNTSANMGVLFHELGHHLRFTTDIMNALTGLDGATARDIIDKYRKSNRTDKDRRATKARLMRLRASPATIAAIEANDPNMADIATAQQFGVMSAEQKAALKELKALDYDVVNGKKTADKGSPEEGLTELLRRMLINKEDMSQTAPNATRLYNRWKKDVPPEVSQKIDAVVEKIGQFVGPNPIERYKKAMGSPRTLLEKTSDALARASRHPTWLADRDVPAREIEDIARKNGMNKDGDPNWVWLSDSLQATRGLAQTLADDDLNGGVSYSPLSESGHMPGDPIQTGGFRTELHNTALTPDQHKEMLVLWWARITVWFDDNVNENRRHENAKKVAQWQIDKKAAIAAGLEPPPKPRLIAEYETGMEVDEARAIVEEIETNRPQELVAAYHSLQHKAQETLRALLVKSVDAGVMDAGHARKAMEQGMYLPLVRNIQEAFSFIAGGGPLDGRGRLKRRTESGSDAGVKNFLEQIYRQVYETNQAIINKMNMDALAGTIDTMQGAPDGMGWLAYRMDKNELYDHIRTQLKNSWKEIAEQAAKYGVSLQSIEEFSDNDALLQAFISIKFLNDKPSSEKGIMIRRETRYYDSNRGEWVDLPKSRLVGYQFVDKDFLQWWLSLSPKEWEWYHQLLATPTKLIKSGVQMFSPGFIGAAPLHDMALGHERERTPQQWSAWEAYGKIPFLSRAIRWGRNMQRTVRSTYNYHRTGEHLDEAEELFMRYVGRVTPQAGSTRNPSHAIHYDIEQSNRAAMRNMSMLDRITASLNSLRNGLTPTNWSLEGAIEGVFSAGEKAMWKLSSVHDLVSEYTGLMDTAERKSEFIGSLDRDGFSLNSDGKFVDRSTGRESSPPWPVLSRAINAAKRVTGDFSAASDELRAVDNFAIPYIAAAATTQYQIWNMRSGRGKAISDMVDAVLGRKKLTPEAAKLASKAMMVMIGGTVMGAMYAAMMRQWRPKEYLAEDPGSLYATFRDSKGDPSGRTRIPRSWFLFFATGQSLVDLYYGDEDRAMRRMWASAKQESPAGNISVPALTVVEAVGDRKLDWDSGRSIQGEYLRKTEHPYRRIKHDTTPVSKWIAENFRIGNWSFAPPAMDHVANEWTGGAYGNIQAAAGYTYGSARNLVQGRSPYGNGGWTIQNTPLGVYFPSKDYFESKRLLTEDYVLNIARDINAKKAEGGDVTVLEQKKVRADFAVLVVQELEKASIAETDKQAREVYRKAIAGVSQWGMGQDADDRTMDNPLNGAESWPPAIQDIVTDRLKSLVYSATEALSTESKEKTSRLDDTIQHRRAIVKRLLSEDKIRWYLQQELTDKRNGGKEFKRETYINRITRLGIDPWPKAN